jgi:hypothetical protein
VLNRFMIGTVGVQVIIVSGPADAHMDIFDELWIRHQVIKGLGFLRQLARRNDPPISLSFRVEIRRVGLTVAAAHLPLLAQNLAEVDAREDVWRDEAQVALGHPRGIDGLRSLVAAGALDHSVVVFATRYPLGTQAYAGDLEPYVVLDWGWIQDTGRGGKGFGRLAHIVAHEVGHAFDAPDEYAGCTLLRPDGTGWGALNFPNFNCVDVNPTSVRCLMRLGRDVEFACQATRVHWGWVDSNQDGILDVFQLGLP